MAKKQRLNSVLKSKSRAQMDDMVDQSTRLISSLTKLPEDEAGHDDEAENWFEDD